MTTDWKEYQEEAALFFRSLGCEATVDAFVRGARASHKVDVWVCFDRFGLKITWVVECKFWKRAIGKEKVMALKAIVDDIGADRGVILSERGFQSGATRAAMKTNLILTSLVDLRRTAEAEILSFLIARLEIKLITVKDSLSSLYINEKHGPGHWSARPAPGVDGVAVRNASMHIMMLEQGFQRIKLGKAPFPVGFDETGDVLEVANTSEEFARLASARIAFAAQILDDQPRPS